MYKKKEIIVIIFILLVTVFLAFLPMIIENTKKNTAEVTETTAKDTRIQLTVKGELTVSELVLTVPNGATYGYVISKLEIYLNEYSVIESDLKKRYYEDTVIVIASSDTNALTEEEAEEEDVSGKINLSTASMDELTGLYGIGEKRAQSIMEYRETHTLDSWETLRGLLGVSDEIIEAIQEKAVLQ